MIGMLQAGAKLKAKFLGSVITDNSRKNIEIICRPNSDKVQGNSPQDARKNVNINFRETREKKCSEIHRVDTRKMSRKLSRRDPKILDNLRDTYEKYRDFSS